MIKTRVKNALPPSTRYALAFGLVMGAAAVGGKSWYQRDKQAALTQVRRRSDMLSTPFGLVEYAATGIGQPVLIMHGAGGGYDQGLLLHELLDAGMYKGISISRPGYRRTPVNSARTFAEQADLYAAVLDHFGVESAIILALSAGGLPALQFAQRYPERCRALILLSAAGPTTITLHAAGQVLPLFQTLISADWLLWLLRKTRVLATLATMGAITSSMRADERKMRLLSRIFEAAFPSSDWSDGMVNDVAHLRRSGINLEQIQAQTLIIHGKRDLQVPFVTAQTHARKLPHAEMVVLENATHFAFATHYDEVAGAIEAFMKKVA